MREGALDWQCPTTTPPEAGMAPPSLGSLQQGEASPELSQLPKDPRAETPPGTEQHRWPDLDSGKDMGTAWAWGQPGLSGLTTGTEALHLLLENPPGLWDHFLEAVGRGQPGLGEMAPHTPARAAQEPQGWAAPALTVLPPLTEAGNPPVRGKQPSSQGFQPHKGLKPHLDTAGFRLGDPNPWLGWGSGTPGWSRAPR